MALTPGHAGDFEYIEEATYGAGLPASGQLEIPSDSIIEAQYEPNVEVKRHYSIDSDACKDSTYHQIVHVVTLDYELQQLKTATQHTLSESLAYFAATRSSGDLYSIACAFDLNGTAIQMKGGKINRYSWTCSPSEAIRVTCEIWGNAVETEDIVTDFTNYSSLDASAAISETIEIYEGASITRAGCWADGIGSFNFEINNHLERVPVLGSQDPAGTYPAHSEFSGGAEVLATAGGETLLDECLAGTEVAIVANSGTTASKSLKFTFANASYNRTPAAYRTEMAIVKIPADWGAESVTLAAYS